MVCPFCRNGAPIRGNDRDTLMERWQQIVDSNTAQSNGTDEVIAANGAAYEPPQNALGIDILCCPRLLVWDGEIFPSHDRNVEWAPIPMRYDVNTTERTDVPDKLQQCCHVAIRVTTLLRTEFVAEL